MPANNSPWTEENIKRLKELADENLSASQIAAHMRGFSRGAIIGKISRLARKGHDISLAKTNYGGGRKPTRGPDKKPRGVVPPLKPVVPDKVSKPFQATKVREKAKQIQPIWKPAPRKPKPVSIPMIEPDIYDRDSPLMSLMDMKPHQCRWPVNDREKDGEHLFCGRDSIEGSSYCQHHKERSVGLGTWSERAAVKREGAT